MTVAASQQATAPPFLALEQVSKRFGGTLALAGIDWSVRAGEIHCLVGENGSGKSTLIKIVAGVHAPDPPGRIRIEGRPHARLSPHEAKALGIQVIYQDLSLFPNLSVMENVALEHVLDPMARPVDRTAMRVAAETALQALHADLSLTARVGTLSIAERQMVAICRGIASKARLLFMDEPTASLTRREVALLLGIVRRLKALAVGVVFVSHRLEEVVEIAERVTVLRDGRKVGTFPASEVDGHRLTELMTGSRIEHKVRTSNRAATAAALEVQGATRRGEFTDVSFTLNRGEVLGLIGLLGSGRTELALSLFGMTALGRGAVKVNGAPVRLASNRDAIAAGIAYLSEDRLTLGLNLRQSITDNIALSALDQLRNGLGLVPRRRRETLAETWISRLDIKAPDSGAAAQTLSGGNQQRVVLAKWLATKPRILLLDSPTVGVDIRNKQGIYAMIRELAENGVAILLISDEVPEVYFNCDRILHMRRGRIAGEFVPRSVSEQALAEVVNA